MTQTLQYVLLEIRSCLLTVTFFKIRVLLGKQGFKSLNIFILIKIQSDSLESPCVLLSRCLHSPGLQSTDVRFPNRPVYFRASEKKARAGRDEEHSWSVANRSCLCKARDRPQFCQLMCNNQSDYTQCKRQKCPQPHCRNRT